MAYYFNLPIITQLTTDQQAAVDETESLALSGGPGTGKSVVCLWRHIRNYATNSKKSLLLTYTKTLEHYLKQSALSQNQESGNNINRTFWWLSHNAENYDEIIIDEGQDVSIEKYNKLKTYSENISYGADDDQSLYEEGCSPIELKGLFPDNEGYTMHKNFRNSKEILLFTRSIFPNILIPQSTINSATVTDLKPIMKIAGWDKEEEQKTNTTFNITNGAAFLPNNLIEVDSYGKSSNSSELKKVSNIQPNKNWSSEINFYNRVMGGFAIMSIAGNEFQNYPLNYFYTLSNINTIIKDEITNQKIDVDNNYTLTLFDDEITNYKIDVNNNYAWVLFDNGDFTKLRNAIYSQINNTIVESFAKKDKLNLSKQNGKYLLNKIDQSKTTYLVAVLASYGQGARMKLDTFISDLISDRFPEKKKEGLALNFGISKGYEAFSNKYKIKNSQIDVKFKLDSQLDYYTIESIYQFAFNKKKDNATFDYIDSWCPRLAKTKQAKRLETYQVLDKTVIYKEKEVSPISNNKICEKIVNDISKSILLYLQNNNLVLFEEHDRFFCNKGYDELRKESLNQIKLLESKVVSLEMENKSLKERIASFEAEKDRRTNVSEKKSTSLTFVFREEEEREQQRKKELSDMGITKLKKFAKKFNVTNLSKYKKANIEELAQIIFNIENK